MFFVFLCTCIFERLNFVTYFEPSLDKASACSAYTYVPSILLDADVSWQKYAEHKFGCLFGRSCGAVRTLSADWLRLEGYWVDLEAAGI